MQSSKQIYYKKNRLQQLRGFCYTVQTGSMSKAAQKMNLSQSTITLQIQSLERDLKMKLFARNNTKITTTKEGKMLYSYCISYIQQMDSLFENFTKYIKDENPQIIDIASNHAGISYILPNYIRQFKNLHSSVKFKIRNLSKDNCIKRLLDDDINMFIYPMMLDEIPEECHFIPIVKYQPILLVNKNHKLAKQKNITLSDIAKFELVRIDPHLITLPAFEELIKSHGIQSSIEFEISDWEILKKFVKADIGVAIISNIIMEGEDQNDLVEIKLTNYFPEMTYGAVIKKGKQYDVLFQEFLELLTTQKLLNAQI